MFRRELERRAVTERDLAEVIAHRRFQGKDFRRPLSARCLVVPEHGIPDVYLFDWLDGAIGHNNRRPGRETGCIVVVRIVIICVIIHPVLVVHEDAPGKERADAIHREVVGCRRFWNVLDGFYRNRFVAIEERITDFQVLRLYPAAIHVEGVLGSDADGAIQYIVAFAAHDVEIRHAAHDGALLLGIERNNCITNRERLNRHFAVRCIYLGAGEETAVLVVHEEVLREVVVLLINGEVVDGDGLGDVLDGGDGNGFLAVEEGIADCEILHFDPPAIHIEGMLGGDADGAVQHIVAVALEREDLGNSAFGALAGCEIVGEDRIACLQGFDGLRAARGGDNSAGEEAAAALVVHEHIRSKEGVFAVHRDVVDRRRLVLVLHGFHVDRTIPPLQHVAGDEELGLYPLTIHVERVFAGNADRAVDHVVSLAARKKVRRDIPRRDCLILYVVRHNPVADIELLNRHRAIGHGNERAGKEALRLLLLLLERPLLAVYLLFVRLLDTVTRCQTRARLGTERYHSFLCATRFAAALGFALALTILAQPACAIRSIITRIVAHICGSTRSGTCHVVVIPLLPNVQNLPIHIVANSHTSHLHGRVRETGIPPREELPRVIGTELTNK